MRHAAWYLLSALWPLLAQGQRAEVPVTIYPYWDAAPPPAEPPANRRPASSAAAQSVAEATPPEPVPDRPRVAVEAGLSGRIYPFGGGEDTTDRTAASLRIEATSTLERPSQNQSLTVHPFVRVDSLDEARNSVDLRELYLRQRWGKAELTAGWRKVFWGAAESVNRVDILNQSDLAESVDGETKLGQPMLAFALPTALGTVEAFYLPSFRERRFPSPGVRGRLPAALEDRPVRLRDVIGQRTDDAALRLSGTARRLDYGLSLFKGINRAPRFALRATAQGPVLSAFYERITQTGLDATSALGAWLLKLEAVHQHGPSENFQSVTTGIEYAWDGALGSGADVGLVAEYLWDSRQRSFYAPFQNDAFLGLRYSLNDAASTQALLGGTLDLASGTSSARLEASRRVGAASRIELQVDWYAVKSNRDALFDLGDDGRAELEWTTYF